MAELSHRSNLQAGLLQQIEAQMEEAACTLPDAFNRVAAATLGYPTEDENIVDGAEDCGIDFWYESDSGFDIFQAKCHELTSGRLLDDKPFDADGVRDLSRVLTLLRAPRPRKCINEKVRHFVRAWEHELSTRRTQVAGDQAERDPLRVNLALVVLGTKLTKPAHEELDRFVASLPKDDAIDGEPVEISVRLVTLDDLLAEIWRRGNRQWQTAAGQKLERIDLRPSTTEFLRGKKDCVFYCRAIDIVNAYRALGYQLFEPNVRCEIRRSRINAAIRDSVRTRLSRRDFRLLNNGITIVCNSYQLPRDNRPCFRVLHPGVVNGLQTVVALSEAYELLEGDDKADFEANCFVLVRLLDEGAVGDINTVVRATNNQNPMHPRNLVSNNTEQVLYERLFANLGWFYERKEGAWEAFRSDPHRWRTLSDKRKKDFTFAPPKARPRARCIDNEVLAQTWMSFIGFSNQAVHEKRSLFSESRYYDLIFLHRPVCHASDADYDLAQALESAANDEPPPQLMLVSYLAREFARAVVLSPAENRRRACERLGLDEGLTPREDVDSCLSKDGTYLVGQVMRQMSFVFVDTLGYMLLHCFGKDMYTKGGALLQNGILSTLNLEYDLAHAAEIVQGQEFDDNDVLAVAWCAFTDVVDDLLSGAWRDSYLAARNRTRFNHSVETRSRILRRLDEVDAVSKKKQLLRTWAVGISPKDGLYGFFRTAVSAK